MDLTINKNVDKALIAGEYSDVKVDLAKDFQMGASNKTPELLKMNPLGKARLQPDPFLNELTNMFERNTEKGSVWVTLKHSSDKSKSQRNRMKTPIEFKCLIRATDGKKNISTLVAQKDHKKFQGSYATILKARMTALKKRERKEKRKAKKTN